jgi:hypothetical protein
MKQVLFFVSLVLFTLPTAASAQTIVLQVKGVDIGAKYQTVLRQLGKPLSSKKRGTNPCGNTKLVLRYSGLTITFDDDGSGRNFIVVVIEVTSPKWEVAPGISVGASLADVQKKFSQTEAPTKEKGLENLSYFAGDGYANFYFRNKKLVKVAWELNLC